MGFFTGSRLAQSNAPRPKIPRCGACGLYKHCESPKMEPSGKGKKSILIVGEAPGETEDRKGYQFAGKSGELLNSTMRKYKVNMRNDCTLTNAIICHPEGNRTPSKEELKYCSPNLDKTIRDLDPDVIIPLGFPALKAVLDRLWHDDFGKSIGKWVGWQIPSQTYNAWICPNYHPSFILRTEKRPVIKLWFERWLRDAVKLQGKPWDEIPDDESKVEIIYDTKKAAKIIRKMIKLGGSAAFDYETNMLKPEGPMSQIICCSICFEGKKTIAFPWAGEAIAAMKEFLLSKRIKKIAANMKFEDRWTRYHLEIEIRNWHFDTMLGAHTIDYRTGTTGLKFQSLVTLGRTVYNKHIEKFLKSPTTMTPNKVLKEIDMDDLLLYCGLDSLYEYGLSVRQKSVLSLS